MEGGSKELHQLIIRRGVCIFGVTLNSKRLIYLHPFIVGRNVVVARRNAEYTRTPAPVKNAILHYFVEVDVLTVNSPT